MARFFVVFGEVRAAGWQNTNVFAFHLCCLRVCHGLNAAETGDAHSPHSSSPSLLNHALPSHDRIPSPFPRHLTRASGPPHVHDSIGKLPLEALQGSEVGSGVKAQPQMILTMLYVTMHAKKLHKVAVTVATVLKSGADRKPPSLQQVTPMLGSSASVPVHAIRWERKADVFG